MLEVGRWLDGSRVGPFLVPELEASAASDQREQLSLTFLYTDPAGQKGTGCGCGKNIQLKDRQVHPWLLPTNLWLAVEVIRCVDRRA